MRPRARVTDLRGRRRSPARAQVLADPSGRRARRLRVVGRMVAVLFLAWLSGLVLAGVGLLPIADIPLGASVETGVRPARVDVAQTGRAPILFEPRTLQPLVAATDRVARARELAVAIAGRRSAHINRTATRVSTGSPRHRRSHGASTAASTGGSRTTRTATSASSTGVTARSSTPASPRGNGRARRGVAPGRSGTSAASSGASRGSGSSASAPGHQSTHGPSHGARSSG